MEGLKALSCIIDNMCHRSEINHGGTIHLLHRLAECTRRFSKKILLLVQQKTYQLICLQNALESMSLTLFMPVGEVIDRRFTSWRVDKHLLQYHCNKCQHQWFIAFYVPCRECATSLTPQHYQFTSICAPCLLCGPLLPWFSSEISQRTRQRSYTSSTSFMIILCCPAHFMNGFCNKLPN